LNTGEAVVLESGNLAFAMRASMSLPGIFQPALLDGKVLLDGGLVDQVLIDADNGGEIDGVIQFCEAVLLEIDTETIVVPGHGPISTYADLRDYVTMLKAIRERVAALIAQGASLEDVVAARPTAQWDDIKGDPTRLLDRAYASLSR
jgi:hypothetical protein